MRNLHKMTVAWNVILIYLAFHEILLINGRSALPFLSASRNIFMNLLFDTQLIFDVNEQINVKLTDECKLFDSDKMNHRGKSYFP